MPQIMQSHVDESFPMLVPIYLEMSDGRILNLGHPSLVGNTLVEQKVALKGPKDAPRRAILNRSYDVLASPN